MTVLNTKAPLNTQAPLSQEMSGPHGGSNKKMRGASLKARLGLQVRGLYVRGLKVRILAVLVLAAPFIASAIIPAQAAMFRLGEVDVQVDSIVSAGVSVRVEDREKKLLAASHGGNADTTPGLRLDAALVDVNQNGITGDALDLLSSGAAALGGKCGIASALANNAAAAATQDCQFDDAADGVYNFDRGLNGDDGRLNFDNGDLTGGPIKYVVDIEASGQVVTAFARISAFYDGVMTNEDSFERSGLIGGNSRKDAEYDIRLLDAYVDFDVNIGENPALIRFGKQVINWGEATFFLGGNSVFSPIDVPAIRRPGAEIKEALLPVEALYTNISLPYDLSLEAYWGGWDHFQLDVGGTPFAGSDAFNPGSAGNLDRFYVGTGRFGGSNKRNCNGAFGAGHSNNAKAYVTAISGALNEALGPCQVGTPIDFRTPNKFGEMEASRRLYQSSRVYPTAETNGVLGDTDYLAKGDDIEPSDAFDDFGFALRWYSETLNSTEFGLYYQKYTSRVPYASSRAKAPVVGLGVTGVGDSATLRQLGVAGCAGSILTGTNQQPNATAKGVAFEDPLGLLPIFAEVARTRAGYTGATSNLTVEDFAELGCDLLAVQMATSPALKAATAACGKYVAGTAPLPGCDINSAGNAWKSALDVTGAGLYLPTGSVFPVLRYGGSIFAEYPEDIEVTGLSFSTTLAGWGVQGEIAYRPNMPLQIDADAVAISAIAGGCAWENFGSAAGVLYGQQLSPTTCGDYGTYHGFVREEVTHYDIGTTATFTRSNPVISFLGADLGVLLTEFQYINAPDVEEYAVDFNANINRGDNVSDTTERIAAITAAGRKPRLANLCTSGSDLPLGGVLSLDPRNPKDCRPTEDSSGGLIFFQLQYNNAFGTAWGLRPQIVYRRGLDGRSPTPAGSWVEDQSVLGLSLTAAYQELDISLGYTVYDGDVLYNPNIDRDTVTLSLKYGF
ncbi:MAG: DUF1302 family protein [Parvibaculales bacterium]